MHNPGPSGTTELQLGIHHVDFFPAALEPRWRRAEREYTRHRGICFPTGRNAELELGGPRVGHPRVGHPRAGHSRVGHSGLAIRGLGISGWGMPG